MNWNNELSVPMVRTRGRNHRNVLFDPLTRKFTQVNNTKPERPPTIFLTDKEEESLIKEFRAIFKREPSEEEIGELVSEEIKLKRGVNSGSNQG